MKRQLTLMVVLLMLLTLFGCSNDSKTEPIEKDETVEENPVVENSDTESNVSAIEYLDAKTRWGIDPGLGVEVLHELGYTGKGVNVAYCDQPLIEPFSDEIKDAVVKYTNNANTDGTMHGAATSSLLAGKNIGTAPDISLYFYSYVSWVDDQQKNWVTCLDELIEDNRKLPEGEKIRMVGFSNNPRHDEPYYDEIMDAVKRCNDEDIMVLWCGENAGGYFDDFADRNNPENFKPLFDNGNCVTAVPSDSRTSLGDKNEYVYWERDGGLSWTMPFTLGIYAIAQSIDYDITEQEIKDLLKETNHINANGAKVMQPVEFIARVLERNNRQEDANELRDAYYDSFKHTYVLYDSSKLSLDDIEAIEEYSTTIIDSYPVLLDCAGKNDAKDIYNMLKDEHWNRGGKIAGIQIMGNRELLPPFSVDYAVDIVNSVDEMGFFYSDYFYQNLNNDANIICDHYSAYRHFNEGLDVDLVPQWPVARLPLGKNEFKDFFKKYNGFVNENGSKKLHLVNFSNPIFAESEHKDDFGIFLDRMHEEFMLYDDDYSLYGNTLGEYPVRNETSGSFDHDSLKMVNGNGPVEMIINSHGQKDNIDLCYFENDQENRKSVLNSDNINKILSDNCYYLDLWTCNGGEDMKNNLTATALNGKAVGVFSASHIISNNGVRNDVSVEDMAKANFYYFYYTYLRSLNDGMTRSMAFFKAQYKYCKALLDYSQYGITAEGNYQFNLCNLLDYENYGVLNNSDHRYTFLDDGVVIAFDEEYYNKIHAFELKEVVIGNDSNGDYVVTVSFKAPELYEVMAFIPPDGDEFGQFLVPTSEGDNVRTFTVPKDVYENAENVMMSISRSDDDRWFVTIK